MTNEIILELSIYSLLPLLLLWLYLDIVKWMKKDNVDNLPVISLFLVMKAYGGLGILLLSILFFKNPDAHFVGILWFFIVVPLLMFFVAVYSYFKVYISDYHSRIYKCSLTYLIAVPIIGMIVIFALFFFDK